ncbi:MAG: ABC transporter ATP-binding protein [Filifactor alocis]|nr:ABC transporter ATP-binding protein [Filifactor alocis]
MTDNYQNEEHKTSKEDIRRLAGYTFEYSFHLFLGLFLLLTAVGFELLAPFAVRRIFDHELKKQVISQKGVLKWIGFYILANYAGLSFQFASNIQLQIMAMKIVRKMRLQIYENIQRIHISFFDNMPAGSIVSKITNDTGAVQDLYVKVLGQIVTSLLYIIGVYVVMFRIQPGLAAVFLLFVPLTVAIFSFYIRKARPHNYTIRTKLSQLNGMLNEAIQGISIIQTFNSQKKTQEEFEQIAGERFDRRMKMLVLNIITSYNAISALRNMVFVLMIYYFGNKVIKTNSITSVGMLYVYVDYIGILFHHIHRIMEQLNLLSRSGAASSHVFEMIDMEGKEVSSDRLSTIRGDVVFENVSFFYKDENYVLQDIDIRAESGQTVALIGHTGSGKSSIMNLLLKFYSPQKGKISIDGMDLAELSDQAIRDQMGIVLQEPYLFTGTILSNITLNKDNISRDEALKALEAVGGEVVLHGLKHGIDEKVVERGSTLSAGQRQLISFARALAQDPRILILDEATSSIDSETEQLIQKAMKVLMKGRTTFVIAHRLSTIKHADRIYLLEKGRIVEEGTHAQLLEKKGRYFDMYRSQNRILSA